MYWINKITRNLSAKTLILAATATFFGCSDDDENTPSLLDNYTITATGMYPEGVDFDDKNNRFLIGSFNQGSISILSSDGTLETFINDSNLIGVTGVYADEENNRLIVASGDVGASEKSGANGSTAGIVAYLGVYDLTTGSLIKGLDLKPLTPNGGAFPNGITVDNSGNIYVTDSFSPVIYKVDQSYNAGVFITNASLFTPAPNYFGLNGAVYHSDGYLIVAKTDENKLFKIMLNDPSQVSEITGVDGMKTPDGLAWTSDNKLVVIENGLGEGKVHILSSADGWSTATQTKEISIGSTEFPTSATLASSKEVYVLTSYLGKLLTGDKTQSIFTLDKISIN
ncbi:SBBP repeat-containing protein [Fulvivirga ulvae]|uniref:SBBP repeat-containing protein n=1 Tax=Fulvivirga ulvae TaxID=2904245 RepID=UPI001F460CA5|nr:SBBP repeat-containing protein [Fulvivirga ulvae]UII31705.1 SBBP repeat-containing protein [Fulvivirga ulvae]